MAEKKVLNANAFPSYIKEKLKGNANENAAKKRFGVGNYLVLNVVLKSKVSRLYVKKTDIADALAVTGLLAPHYRRKNRSRAGAIAYYRRDFKKSRLSLSLISSSLTEEIKNIQRLNKNSSAGIKGLQLAKAMLLFEVTQKI